MCSPSHSIHEAKPLCRLFEVNLFVSRSSKWRRRGALCAALTVAALTLTIAACALTKHTRRCRCLEAFLEHCHEQEACLRLRARRQRLATPAAAPSLQQRESQQGQGQGPAASSQSPVPARGLAPALSGGATGAPGRQPSLSESL